MNVNISNEFNFSVVHGAMNRSLTSSLDHVTSRDTMLFMEVYLHFSKTSLDEPLDVHLCSYFHEQHRVSQRHSDVNKQCLRQSDTSTPFRCLYTHCV